MGEYEAFEARVKGKKTNSCTGENYLLCKANSVPGPDFLLWKGSFNVKRSYHMSRRCTLSNKQRMVGNRVSHAKNRTKVSLMPNVQNKKIYSTQLGKFVKIKVCTSALRTINKIGIEAYCAKAGITLA